jgi:hypothetical protein
MVTRNSDLPRKALVSVCLDIARVSSIHVVNRKALEPLAIGTVQSSDQKTLLSYACSQLVSQCALSEWKISIAATCNVKMTIADRL